LLKLLLRLLLCMALQHCRRAPQSRDTTLGPGEVAVKVVTVASLSGTARSIELFETALQVLAASKGRWDWAVFTYKCLLESGFQPSQTVLDLIVTVRAW
jgi:hypothetical protein